MPGEVFVEPRKLGMHGHIDKKYHIDYKELKAVYLTLQCLASDKEHIHINFQMDNVTDRQTDRQTDILLTEIKVIIDLFVIVIREIYVHVYTRMLVC